ncbi:MAG TPA: hypothetical protein VJB87_00175 [Candidatus Nanoarchaeia archaeon]|nr:hypothetical protein [Candidatus Nanoarchaeia archaeon]
MRLFQDALPGMFTIFLIIIMIITVIGIASTGIRDTNEYYPAALENYINYLLTACFAEHINNEPIIGIIDQERITPTILNTCARNNFIGIHILINGKEQLSNQYYQLTGSGCGVTTKPYSCITKNYRLLIKNKETTTPADIVITAITKHLDSKDITTPGVTNYE